MEIRLSGHSAYRTEYHIVWVRASPWYSALRVNKEILKKTSIELNWGSDYHFVIVTGLQNLLTGRVEDVVYPLIE